MVDKRADKNDSPEPTYYYFLQTRSILTVGDEEKCNYENSFNIKFACTKVN